MSARLTPTGIAQRELARLQARIERHQREIQALAIEQDRWQAVLTALDGTESSRDDHVEE